MRQDRRPYWVKKTYLKFRYWYAEHFLRPACDELGAHHTIMKPWYVDINGPNITIGKCVTIVAEKYSPVKIGVWGRQPDSGKISIGDYVLLSPGVRLSASDEIIIGNNVMMANGVYLSDSDWHGVYDRTERDEKVTPIILHDNVWLGDSSIVLKGVTIGENSIVGANAVVSKDVPANVVVAGNPAKVVKHLDSSIERVTRREYFANPAEQAKYFDGLDRMVLEGNGFFNWLRTLIKPNNKD
ncbi:acyltransferase [Sinobacterium norvegicum]|nr:acyltransferase [Sinobacterium norvegicum]